MALYKDSVMVPGITPRFSKFKREMLWSFQGAAPPKRGSGPPQIMVNSSKGLPFL